MPEGPEIKRAADQVSAAIKERPILEISLNLPHLKPYEHQFKGSRVISVTSFGKAMLTKFQNGLTLYSHNQLYGRWYTVPSYQFPVTKRQLRVAIHNAKMSALLYSASEIQILTPDELKHHKFLSRLGPDVLSVNTTSETILRQLSERKFYNRQLGRSLTDQSMLAGLGNYLRCEILFASKLHPSMRPCDCSDQQLLQLSKSILNLTHQSYKTGGITNNLTEARRMISQGVTFEEARFFVYRREECSCYRCGVIIKKYYAGNQSCYICPDCQPEGKPSSRTIKS